MPVEPGDIPTLEIPKPLSPANGISGINTQPVLTVDFPSGDQDRPIAARWQITAQENNWKDLLYDRSTFDTVSHVAIAALPFDQTCYWRASWLNGTGWSQWSEAVSFVTCASPGPKVHIFQDGYRDYDGTRDVDIRGNGADLTQAIRDWNQGRQDVLRTGRRGTHLPTDETYRSFLKFDISVLSKSDAISNAYLVLTGWEHDWRDFPTKGHALNSVYRVRREWHEGIGIMNRNPQDGEISWHYNQYPQRWVEPGASFQSDDPMMEADIEATALGDFTAISRVGAKMTFSSNRFVDAVKDWVANPETNYGVLIRAADHALRETMNIASREHPVGSHRPKLVIESYERSEFEGCVTHFSDP
ncbi:MAG: DNRLRE domain-containing protein [Candidatus Latescibacteria bacterium]|jgi:hypothetical protein|nr:DNRLRE domain-containing protein [Candidatus Latescibacterota bacterium]